MKHVDLALERSETYARGIIGTVGKAFCRS